ncbi:MAG: hypothetical protein JSR99_09875 [Proteobacteria bacterium]|nr:hypothetical protein [Pseudomonadota bacterium]
MWIIGVLFGQALLVGIIAQKGYKRVGLIWGLAALALGFGLSFFVDNAIRTDPRFILDEEYRQNLMTPGHDIAFVLMTSLPAAVLTLLAVATLPKSKS